MCNMYKCTSTLLVSASVQTHSGVSNVDAMREPTSNHQCQDMHRDKVDQEDIPTPRRHLRTGEDGFRHPQQTFGHLALKINFTG